MVSRMQNSYYIAFLIFFVLPTPQAAAQTGTCEQATAEAFLDIGNVRARIFNQGGLFWRQSPNGYQVPKDGNSHALFAANIWVSGLIDNEMRVAGSSFGPWEFWPGPIDDAGNPPADCTPYDQIWEINRNDINAFFEFGTISENMANWPWQLGAPVIDGDGNPNNYNLAEGDLPELIGHQRLWWIMNDRGNVHERSGSEPLGIEVHGTAIGYEFPQLVENNTFYSYQLINKNTSTIEDAYFTFWTDGDLGNFDDDYVGSDTLLGLAYYYNSDNDDEGGEGYGANPPAVGFMFLKTPPAEHDFIDNDRDNEVDEAGEELGVTIIMNHQKSGGALGDPSTLQDYFNYARGIWKDGQPLQEGIIGYRSGGGITRFYMPGDPVTGTFWSELNADGMGLVLDPADRRLHASTGPFTLAPGDTVQVAFGVVWARGDDNLDSVRKLKADVASLNEAAEAILTPSIQENPFPQQDPVASENFVLGFDQNFPNPFTQSTTIRYSLPQSMQVRLAVFDILGREVAVLVQERQDAGIYSVEFDAGVLPAGVYLARLEANVLQFTKRILKVN